MEKNKALQAEHDAKRELYLASKLTHHEFYIWLADQIGVVVSDLPVSVDRIRASTDEHLNDVHLALWDRQDRNIRSKAHAAGMRSWSLCQTTCTLKEYARRAAKQ